jgi:hypothetical protein
LAIRRAVAARELEDLRSSASTPGFADTSAPGHRRARIRTRRPAWARGRAPATRRRIPRRAGALGLRDRDGVRRKLSNASKATSAPGARARSSRTASRT